MKNQPGFTIEYGVRPDHRGAAVELFWEAFRGKLAPVMKPEAKAKAFLYRAVDPDHAISAISAQGELIGVAGYKTRTGSFVGGGIADLCQVYGWFGGLWRGLLLSVLDRANEPGTLLMDGIFVSSQARGQGVGTALLDAIKHRAQALGCDHVRLDVIDINPRARALYERQGFVAGETEDAWPFNHIFGFRAATRMDFTVRAPEHGAGNPDG